MLLPPNIINDTTNGYLPKLPTKFSVFYTLICLGILGAIASLPFIKINISTKASGITRPSNERSEIKASANGIIDTLFFKEGDFIKKGNILLQIKNPTAQSKLSLLLYEIKQRQSYINDLLFLTKNYSSDSNYNYLQSPIYKEQANKYYFQLAELNVNLKKAHKEMDIFTKLYNQQVIAYKEFFDYQNNLEKLNANYKAFTRNQISLWQQDLAKFTTELTQLKQQVQQSSIEANLYKVIASVSGTIQGIANKYTGAVLYANDIICTISPEENLIAECYINSKDVGLIKLNQPVHFMIDAFDYKYFGTLTGSVLYIDNDFSVIDNKPVFKVRCLLNKNYLQLKNGFKGNLKKGLTLQARFLVTQRSLWQLLYDTVDDWINPISNPKNS